MWKWNLGEYYVWLAGYAYSTIGWHWGIALYFLLPLYALHTWRRWHHPKKADFDGRRQALKLLGLGIASAAAWGISEAAAKMLESDSSARRFTGSREQGSFEDNAHPITSGPDQGRIKIDPATWSLSVAGAVDSPLRLSHEVILTLSKSEVTATLDCTGGWYTVQTWRGVRLLELLEQARLRSDAAGIRLKGVLDYSASFTLEQAREIVLATHVGEEVLNHLHGFPLRAVVPSRRGWHWVKWLTEVEVVTSI
jgi:DMSO/TMAO reductase YedYZ molybdopterin-dependent catalytic subunit